jgi:hypothetical protein
MDHIKIPETAYNIREIFANFENLLKMLQDWKTSENRIKRNAVVCPCGAGRQQAELEYRSMQWNFLCSDFRCSPPDCALTIELEARHRTLSAQNQQFL